jgi:hypothetical protein
MAERIFQLAVAVSPEHIGQGHFHLGAGRRGLLEHRIHILHVQEDTARSSAQRLRERLPIPGISSASISMESPCSSSASPILPFGTSIRMISFAPNARAELDRFGCI